MGGRFSRKLLCAAVASACVGTAIAAPVGPVVGVGSAVYVPATLTVTSTTARTQISWQSFNVAANEVVRFIQPSAQSSVLNLVFTPQSLNILGRVTSNGSVMFLSNGIVSGSGTYLDLAGVINTSLRFSQQALATGGLAPAGQHRPLATLAEGRIYVIGQDDRAVTTANGDVVLNPGKSIELANASMPQLRVEVTAPRAEAINLSRLVAGKRETGIFAGLFRAPAAARRAADGDGDAVLTAAAEERIPLAPNLERFYRYALLYAQLRLEDEAGPMKVAAAGSRTFIAAAKSRPGLLPQDIVIGAPAERPREAPAPMPEPSASAPPAPEPQPIPVRQPPEPDLSLVAGLEMDPAQGRYTRRSAPAAIVVALAQQATPASSDNSKVKEIVIERHAPRFFTDYRGAIFHM
jgi:filamentous hemagglutinin family protein